jgi:GntR family transcriptional regulator, transcriptional repressor for pyruvate dehydrogenase complex
MVFQPVTTRRTFEEALAQIVEAIRAGDLRVGDRIDSERTLAAQMRISRPTVREAIKVLSDAGVIDVRSGPGGGMFVRSENVPRDLLESRLELRLNEVAGVLEARRMLEPRVAQLAGLYASEEDFDALQKIIDLQRECGDDHERALQLDHRFHLRIARSTKNTTVVSMMRLLLQRLEIARDMTPRAPHDPELEVAIHEQTLEAIKSGDPDRIEAAMDEHVSYLERIWEEETGRVRLRPVPSFLQRRSDGAEAR